MADKNEIVDPPRTVVLSALQIAATETTQQQYGRVYPDYGKAADVPVVDVTWEQARAFCQQIGGALPTEAQWEYAARGGSRFPWSFGDDAALLEHYAWFDKNSSGQAHEVKKKLSNLLGLYDMHGNVWEWVRDWYGDYQSGVFVDPLGPSSEIFRVVRGGSFAFPPESLRSARRGLDLPALRDRHDGFRCVRVPPQP
jgi:formylglycine-generating enzyme required for sulfatase activity